MHRSFGISILFWCAAATLAHGQETGTTIRPKGDLPLRSAPPGAFFQDKGAQLGTAKPDEIYRVIDSKRVPTLFGSESWVKVQAIREPDKSGWIFGGSSSDPIANIAKVPN